MLVLVLSTFVKPQRHFARCFLNHRTPAIHILYLNLVQLSWPVYHCLQHQTLLLARDLDVECRSFLKPEPRVEPVAHGTGHDGHVLERISPDEFHAPSAQRRPVSSPLELGKGSQNLELDLLRPNWRKQLLEYLDLPLPKCLKVLVVCVQTSLASSLSHFSHGCAVLASATEHKQCCHSSMDKRLAILWLVASAISSLVDV